MSEQKNKGGRPRRAPGEKLQRVTLNLRPSIMFGLDLIARDRQTSLSQAAEYALATVLRGYDIDGKSALEIAQAAMLIDSKSGKPIDEIVLRLMQGDYKHSDGENHTRMIEEIKRLQRGESPLMAVTIPPRLRTPEEAFIMKVVEHRHLDPSEELDKQVKVIKDSFRLGLSVEETAKHLAIAPARVRPKKKNSPSSSSPQKTPR